MLFIGVDGGGTTTDLTLLDQHKAVTSTLRVGPSNWNSVGRETTQQTLESSILSLLNGHNTTHVLAVCLSLAGVHSDEDKALIRMWIQPLLPNALVIVENDVVAGLASGTEGKLVGVTCISGTGMNCWGRTESGETASSGGMGPLLGDRGSGFAIGQEALDVCAWANDGRGSQTELLPAILQRLNRSHFEELIDWRYSQFCTHAQVADLALTVFNQAKLGDEIAISIVNNAANALVQTIEAVVKRLKLEEHQFPIVLVGSIWNNKMIFNRVQQEVMEKWSQVVVKRPEIDGAVGAALVAFNAQDWSKVEVSDILDEPTEKDSRSDMKIGAMVVLAFTASMVAYAYLKHR